MSKLLSSKQAFSEIKIKLKKKQEWLAVWMILSGETNIRERKQNKKYKATVRPIMTCVLEKNSGIINKTDRCWKKIR